jgi:hypothetical protein
VNRAQEEQLRRTLYQELPYSDFNTERLLRSYSL